MPEDDWFILNVNEDELEVVHHDPPTAQCDLGHTIDDVRVDKATAAALIDKGQARYCQHCFLEQEPGTLNTRDVAP
jgi:hypothetical protein